jgi:hypothetical protein
MTPDILDYYFDKQERTNRVPLGCYANFVGHFLRCIDTTSTSVQFETNVQQGLQTFILIEAINRSIDQKTAIKLKNVRTELQ